MENKIVTQLKIIKKIYLRLINDVALFTKNIIELQNDATNDSTNKSHVTQITNIFVNSVKNHLSISSENQQLIKPISTTTTTTIKYINNTQNTINIATIDNIEITNDTITIGNLTYKLYDDSLTNMIDTLDNIELCLGTNIEYLNKYLLVFR